MDDVKEQREHLQAKIIRLERDIKELFSMINDKSFSMSYTRHKNMIKKIAIKQNTITKYKKQIALLGQMNLFD